MAKFLIFGATSEVLARSVCVSDRPHVPVPQNMEIVMRMRHRLRTLAVCSGFLTLLLAPNCTLHAQPTAVSDNLPIFTSPIDVTGLKLVLSIVAPDRESGAPVEIALPAGFVGPKFSQVLSTPINEQFDKYWAVDPDPQSGLTPRAAACDAPGGIKQQLGERAHDVTCDFASKGEVLAKQTGSTVTLAYLLRNNSVTFQATSPATCNPAHGNIFCPDDPRFTIKFAVEA